LTVHPFRKESVDVKIDVKILHNDQLCHHAEKRQAWNGSERAMKWAIFLQVGECLT